MPSLKNSSTDHDNNEGAAAAALRQPRFKFERSQKVYVNDIDQNNLDQMKNYFGSINDKKYDEDTNKNIYIIKFDEDDGPDGEFHLESDIKLTDTSMTTPRSRPGFSLSMSQRDSLLSGDDSTDTDLEGKNLEKSFDDKPASTKKVAKRKSGFTPEELLMLSKAWGYATNDSVQGTNQKGMSFWNTITDKYAEIITVHNNHRANQRGTTSIIYDSRTQKSLKSQWCGYLQPSVNIFAGICANYPPASGEIENDKEMDKYYSARRADYNERVIHRKLKKTPKIFDKWLY